MFAGIKPAGSILKQAVWSMDYLEKKADSFFTAEHTGTHLE
jgi:hypothetical protein